jgi:hypothetical protein
MTREPLMLSDTAMVLLRQYVELQEDTFETFSRSTNSQIFNSMQGSHWTLDSEFRQELENVAYELMNELRLLWLFTDLGPLRHLDWHFTLEDDLMNRLNELFEPAPIVIEINGVSFHPIGNIAHFVDCIAVAYKEALAIHTQTKTTP